MTSTLHRRGCALFAGLALALGLARCGPQPTLVLVEVHAELRIPDQVDALALTVQDQASGSELTSILLRLDPGQTFPLRVSFEPDGDTPPELTVTATGLLSGTAVGSAQDSVRWARDQQTLLILPALAP